MATNRDKIQVNDSLDSLDVEETRDPYRFALPGNKIITFPDPMDMGFVEAEEFVRALTTGEMSLAESFEKWLSEEDFKALKDANLTLRQVAALTQKVAAHYQDVFGDPGN